MAYFLFPTYTPDSRANWLERYEITRLAKTVTADRWVYLYGPPEAAHQYSLMGGCEAIEVPDSRRSEWTHAFHFTLPQVERYRSMGTVLKEVLSLTAKPHLDCAIACDWYKIPPSEEFPAWRNTPFGELVHRGKYYEPGAARSKARRDLISETASLLQRHPLYDGCAQIVTVPGHKADGRSFGEQLAGKIASETGRNLIATECPGGARPQAKEGASEIPDGHFSMPERIEGDVIILDDVYKSGTTMSAVAKAAKLAGARRVFGFAVVRTMRK